MSDTRTPELPWLLPRTETFYVYPSGRAHRDGDVCSCPARRSP